jgi:precorrin-6B methylase 2
VHPILRIKGWEVARERFTSVGNFFGRAAAYGHKYYLRRFMPKVGPVLHAGAASTLDWRLFDKQLPPQFRPPDICDIPDYEEKLVIALRTTVKPGDKVLVIGGGNGITAAIAAQLAGPKGKVICYEASSEQLPIIRQTFARNKVEVELRFGAVGEAIGVYGDGEQAPVVAPEDLPECDILEMDCEGAERIILERMTIRPRAIAVETHRVYGAPKEAVREALEKLNYSVTDMGIAEPRLAATCIELGVDVLMGQQEAHTSH